MAKILRKTSTPFGLSGPATSFGQFGSKEAGFPQTTKDPTVIQQLAAWVNGWQDAVVTANKAAYLEDMNGLCYVFSYMISYLFQAGVAEWDSGTTYYIDSIVQANGGQQFTSLQDNNAGNAPPVGASNAFWKWINPPECLAGSLTLGTLPKVTSTAPTTGAAGSRVVSDSAVSEDVSNVILAKALKFPDGSVQSVAAATSSAIPKAWVRFNGFTAAIQGSFNITSVVRVSTGQYVVTFTTPFANTNYGWVLSAADPGYGAPVSQAGATTVSVNSLLFNLYGADTNLHDATYVNIAFFSTP